jgi:hypothetical protein
LKIPFIYLIPFLVLAHISAAQTNATKRPFFLWASAGGCATFAGQGNVHGLRWGIEASFDRAYYIHLVHSRHDRIDFSFQEAPSHLVLDFQNSSVLLGYAVMKTKGKAIIAYTGLSFGTGRYKGDLHYYLPTNGIFSDRRGVYEMWRYEYFALPLHVKALFSNVFTGIGLEVYCNIHRHTDFGLVLSVNLGFMNKAQDQIRPQ